MDDLRKEVDGCFGVSDGVFAGHATDEQRARELRKKVKAGTYSWGDVEFTIYGILAKRGSPKEHISEQVKKAKKFFGVQ